MKHLLSTLSLLAYPLAAFAAPQGTESGPTDPEGPTRTCVVERIIDGDTIVCEWDERIRLIGMDTPELSQKPYGGRAADALAELLPVGSTVEIEEGVEPLDRYGRRLAHVWAGGTLVNWSLVRRGYAVLLTVPPNVRYVDELTEAQTRAREEGAGLWADGVFDCTPARHRRGDCEEAAMSFELDHVFAAAAPGAPQIDALTAEGFIESGRQDHPGQGTASRGIFFENAYIELIWLDDSNAAASPPIQRTHLAERADVDNAANPFGICFRADEPNVELPFETWEYKAPYLPSGAYIPMGVNSEQLDEPLLFFLPWRQGPAPDPPDHPNGARRVTRVALEFPATDAPSPELEAFAKLGLVQIDVGPQPLLRVELDDGRQGKAVDLRPGVPLVVSW